MQNTGHYTEAMYVQAAKASSSNRIIVEKDLINLPNGTDRNYKRMDREKLKRVLQKKNVEKGFGRERGPDVNMASRRLLGEKVGCY